MKALLVGPQIQTILRALEDRQKLCEEKLNTRSARISPEFAQAWTAELFAVQHAIMVLGYQDEGRLNGGNRT